MVTLQGTKAPITKPQSIIEFVKRMNHRFRVPDFNSPLDSAQLTLPAGYSPPMPMPTCTKNVKTFGERGEGHLRNLRRTAMRSGC